MSFWRRRINRHWRRRRERRDGSAATLLERLPAGGAGRAAILAAA